ncbi:thioredoxin family protein [Pseudohyphozyma bogoriensis]|nr:thioredoxin family protein [Pseudohyphozyma bogoriensis]
MAGMRLASALEVLFLKFADNLSNAPPLLVRHSHHPSRSSEAMSITVVNSLEHLNTLAKGTAISVIDFHAMIAPVFQKVRRLAGQYVGRVQFLKVDVDAVPDVARQFNVTAMPTFVVLKGNQKVGEMKGANGPELEALVRKHAPTSAAGSSAPEKGLENFGSLNSAIDSSSVNCLNESDSHTIRHLLKGGGDKWLESDADEQLLLHLPMQAARIRAIKFTTVGSAFAQAPKSVKLFVNKPTLGFDDAESQEAAQELELSEKQAKGEEAIQLRFVRFQNVTCLSVFVSANQGDEDVSRIDKLEIIGTLVDGTDMSQLSKGDDHDH